MLKLWMQAYANIRKTKSVSITLAALFLVAALLINIGLLVSINYGNFFSSLKKELNSSDAYYYMSESLYSDKILNSLESNEHVKKTEVTKSMTVGGEIYYKDKDRSFSVMFNNMNKTRELSKWKYVGEYLSPEDMSVYIPEIFKAVGGYNLGDKLTLKYKDIETNQSKELSFTVKGYIEDVFFSSTDTGMMGFYLPEETYNKVSGILNNSKYESYTIFTNLDSVKNSAKVENSLRELLKLNTSSFMASDSSKMLFSIDIDLITLSRCMMASMIAVMMVIFAAIIVVVCLLVVRFRIINSLEDDIMKIGSLKSIGYTNRQIISTILIQFLTIAGLGSLAGIAVAYPLLPFVSIVFEQQSGLKWVQGFDFFSSFTTLATIFAIVIVVTFLAANKVKNLTPVLALRGETSAKKYSKNYLPLEKTRGNLSVLLAFKSILQGIKLNIMIIVIIIAVTFAGAYGVIMYYNTTVDTTAFAEIPGYEITNVIAALDPQRDNTDTINTIKSMENVYKVQYLDELKIKVGDVEASCFAMDNFNNRNTNLVYKGSYPQNPGEIALAGVLAERINKSIGDTVSVTIGENTQTFKVTGLSNGSSMGGINTCLLVSDVKKLNPEFRQQNLYIYLDKGTDAAKFIDKLVEKIPRDILLGTSNFDKLLAEGMSSYQNIVGLMGISMFVITLFVITLVLYFVISSSIIKKKRELGIKKATGFTTLQLMNQLSISFIIPIFIGASIGSILGAFLTNPMMSVFMKSAGIMKTRFIVDPIWISVFALAILAFSYLLSILITLKIRKISAYELVNE